MPSINTEIHLPSMNNLGSTLANSSSMSATGDVFAAPTHSPQTGNVTGVKFATGTVTTGCTVAVTIETVDSATGFPTGTLYHANATTTVVIANTDDNVLKTATFPGNVPTTKGDPFAIVIRVSSGTPTTMNFRAMTLDTALAPPSRYRVQAGTTTLVSSQSPCMSLTYTTGEVALQTGLPHANSSNLTMSTTTTPDEVGIKFTVPFNCRSTGFSIRSGNGAGFKASDVVLYDSSNNVVASATLNSHFIKGLAADFPYRQYWSSTVDLKKGRTYRLVLKPTTSTSWTTALVKLSTFSATPASFSAISYAYTQRTDAGSWSDDTDSAVAMTAIIDKIYQPGGSFM